MKDVTTELLARIEMLEADMDEIRQYFHQGIVFVSDMDKFEGMSDIELLEFWDVNDEVEQ